MRFTRAIMSYTWSAENKDMQRLLLLNAPSLNITAAHTVVCNFVSDLHLRVSGSDQTMGNNHSSNGTIVCSMLSSMLATPVLDMMIAGVSKINKGVP